MARLIFDIEGNDLLENALDYSRTPYRLKPDFKIHCVMARDVDTDMIYEFVGDKKIKEDFPRFLEQYATEIIGHNILDYDLPVLFLYAGVQYRVGYWGEGDTVMGQPCRISDTLVMSKLLYSDTVMGHSLGDWGFRLGEHKIDWRAEAIELGLIEQNAPRGAEFATWHPRMGVYCKQDLATNLKLYHKLMEEWNAWDWELSYWVEAKTAENTVGQKLYGFHLDTKLAERNVAELTVFMEELKAAVDPVLPPKRLNKGEQKEFVPPKLQFKKNGEPSSNMEKFAAKHGWTLEQCQAGTYRLLYGDTSWQLPLEEGVPLITTGVASITDNDHVKGYLLELGWEPTAWKERDLTMDSKKKKLSPEKFEETVKRYVEDTLNSPYKKHRLEFLEADEDTLEFKLLNHKDLKKPLRVRTSPQVTLPPEKELCPGLVALGEKVSFAKKFSDYMTYRHRKNSIAGGVDEETGEPSKGYLTAVREDGRIPTPADTNGCNTGRYQHRVVANIPRVTSLYGENMRAMFGVSKNKIQLGFDFASLEARIEGHYVYKYKGGPELAKLLLQEKPNDIHTLMGKKLGIIRDHAKSMNYALLYGAQPPKIAKMLGIPLSKAQHIYNQFWDELAPLKELKTNVEKYWDTVGQKKFILGIDGRKIYTRSKHSLLNALFQSAGALAAKYVALEIARRLEEKGLWLHPLVHDVENSSGVSQMIVYHDECQYSISRDLVNFHTFETEDEAKAFKKPLISAVGHGKVFYRAESMMAQVIEESIQKVVKDLKIKVELGFEWQTGRNWAQCH